jgi:hypothetical protein
LKESLNKRVQKLFEFFEKGKVCFASCNVGFLGPDPHMLGRVYSFFFLNNANLIKKQKSMIDSDHLMD